MYLLEVNAQTYGASSGGSRPAFRPAPHFHDDGLSLAAAPNMRLVFLPPYCPELNPTEDNRE